MRIRFILPLLLLTLFLRPALFGQQPPSIAPAVNGFTDVVGTPFSQTFTCVNCGTSPLTWIVSAGTLPSGLSLDPVTGIVSGTPVASENDTFTISATFGTQVVASATYFFATANPLLFQTPSPLPAATAGTPVSRTVQVTVTSLWDQSQNSLPDGVSLSLPPNGGTTATISGTFPPVSAPTTYSVSLTATDQVQTITQTYSITSNPPPVLTGNFPGGETGAAYSGGLTVAGGTAPFVFTLINQGTFPAGLSLNAVTGAITGIPTQSGGFTFPALVTDANGAISTGTFKFSIAAAPVIVTTALPAGQVGVAYSATLAATGGSPGFTWTIPQGNLPAGLTLNAASGTIAGTPVSPGLSSFTVQAADTAGVVAAQALSINVLPRTITITTAVLPGANRGSPYAATLAASGGNPPFTWTLVSGQLPPGLTLNSSGSISGITSAAALSNFSFTVQVSDTAIPNVYPGGTATRALTIGIAVPQLTINTSTLPAGNAGQAYSALLSATGGNPPYTWGLDSGQLPPGLTLNSGGQLAGTPTTPGNYSITVHVTDTPLPTYLGSTTSASLTVTISPGTLTILSTTLAAGITGQSYNASLAASGGTPPYSWSLSGGALPAGVTLTSGGLLSGTPGSAGSFSFTATVRDSQGQSVTHSFNLTITSGLTITTPSLSDGEIQAAYQATIAAAGGTPPYSFSLSTGSLPAGLTLASTGAITGIPSTAATASFTAVVTDSNQAVATQAFTLIVNPAVQLTAATLPAGTHNVSYSASLAASSGLAPYTFRVSSGALPAGLTLSSSGAISGTPTVVGSFTFTAVVTDQAGGSAAGTFAIRVVETPGITPTALPAGTVGSNYSTTLSGTGTGPFTWTVLSGSLPDGLILNSSTGTIAGTPSKAGIYKFTAGLSDSSGAAASSAQTYSINIALPALPPVTVTQLPSSIGSGSQPVFGIGLGQFYPVDLTGTATLSFAPISGSRDPAILFSNGSTTLSFTIPAGQTLAVSPTEGPFALQTGTTAGTATITIVLSTGDQTLDPNPAVTQSLTIAPAAPVISSVKINPTAAGFNVVVTGFSNTHEISAASFTFNASAGSSLADSQFSIPVDTTFQAWFGGGASAAFGGQFVLTVPFTVAQGALAGLSSVQVALTNGVGSTGASGKF